VHVEPSEAVTLLSSLSRGQEATVADICGSSSLATRLREFGCLRGAALRVLRVGSTLMLQLGELRLCIRRRDAEVILVIPVLALPELAGSGLAESGLAESGHAVAQLASSTLEPVLGR